MFFGAIIGDIIGSPYEFNRNHIKTKDFELFSSRSIFTDDTVMTLAVADALYNFEKGSDIDEKDFENAVIKSMRHFGKLYPDAGYGPRFEKWIFAEDPKPYKSCGNGSAMRVSPVAWYFDDIATVEKFAEISARVSHNHPEGIKGAQATAAAIFLARTGKSRAEIKNYIAIRYGYDLNRTCDEIRPTYQDNKDIVNCQGTVPEAIIAFLEGENFEDAVRNAVSLGGDSDTLADITAAIAQGMWGIPEDIEQKAKNFLDDFMLDVIERWNEALNHTEKREKFKNGITELVFVLDKSGSMHGLESDTIGGFNSMLKKQRQEPGEAFVSTVLFNQNHFVIHDRVNLSEVPNMTERDYHASGSTALLDAIGRAVRHISREQNKMPYEKIPEHTIFIIITDGHENASVEFSSQKVKSMIQRKQEKENWEFLFLGANIDAVNTAGQMGISQENAVDYFADQQGTNIVYQSVSERISHSRRREKLREWRGDIQRYYQERKREQ